MRVFANFTLYGGIGALTAAQAWPDDQPITWRFWVGVTLGFCVAAKALMSEGGKKRAEEPQNSQGT